MRRAELRIVKSAVAALAFVASFAGCSSATLPGTTLGTYAVTGTSASNTCGAGLGAPSPWSFSVQISKDTTTLYWSWMDGSPPLSGALTAQTATIAVSTTANVDGTDAGPGPCTMQRTDSLAVTLADATNAPATFSGTFSYAFAVPLAATCTDQLTSGGGTYDVLPCTVIYTLAATRK